MFVYPLTYWCLCAPSISKYRGCVVLQDLLVKFMEWPPVLVRGSRDPRLVGRNYTIVKTTGTIRKGRVEAHLHVGKSWSSTKLVTEELGSWVGIPLRGDPIPRTSRYLGKIIMPLPGVYIIHPSIFHISYCTTFHIYLP